MKTKFEPCNPHPIDNDGTSRRRRAASALDPARNPVDGRNLVELIGYAERYAEVLQFWSESDSRAGDWQEFVKKDVTALVARIGREDIPELRELFRTAREAVETAPGAELPARFGELYARPVAIARRLDEWYRAAPDALSLKGELEDLLSSSLGQALRAVVAQVRRAQIVNPAVPEPPLGGFHPIWQIDNVLPDASLFPGASLNQSDDQAKALAQLARAHGQLIQGLQHLAQRAPALLHETLHDYPEHQPHMALLLAFLQLFDHAREHLNRLTAEHMRFYYRRVLGFEPAPRIADRVHLVLEPAKNLDGDIEIPKGTAFKGGKDEGGIERIYATDEPLVLNRTQVDGKRGLKSVRVEMQQGAVSQIRAAPHADSADGLGGESGEDEGSWAPFGNECMPYAEVGFAVASPMLRLAEGKRTIRVRFELDNGVQLPANTVSELRRNIKIQGSGGEGWIDLDIQQVLLNEKKGRSSLEFQLYLDATAPALTAYDRARLDGGFDTRHPVLRFILDNEGLPVEVNGPESGFDAEEEATGKPAMPGGRKPVPEFDRRMQRIGEGTLVRHGNKLYRSKRAIEHVAVTPGNDPQGWELQETAYPYRHLQGLEVAGLTIEVEVSQMRDLLLENDQGLLDPAKPFLPFGSVPRAGSAFLIGSREVFSKPLNWVRLDLSWLGLPNESFGTYYSDYGGAENGTAFDSNFTATPAFLLNGDWDPESSARPLFGIGEDGAPAASRCFEFEKKPLIPRNLDLGDYRQYRAGMRQGYLRLTLERDFGHEQYPRILASQASTGTQVTVKPPYVPLASDLRLSYRASQKVDYRGRGKEAFADRVEQLFQIWPFGQREIWPINDMEEPGSVPVERRLVPHFEVTSEGGGKETAEGTLYVGLEGLDLSGGSKTVSVLVQVAEGSADPELPVQPVVWSYLANDVWHDFRKSEILADGSNGLLRSGIIRFALPRGMTNDNHILPSGLYWIKASVSRHTEAVCRLIGLHTQAVTASLRDQGNHPAHFAKPLQADSIAKLKARMAAVKTVSQPYASFGGRAAEAEQGFNERASERLRHKGRAITLFDYERLVLQAFPDIYKVKCINHANRHGQHVPGSVRVIVVPDLRNRNAVDPLRPRVSLDTLDRIREFLADRASDFVDLTVTNPDYEAIRVNCQVRFHPEFDQGLHLRRLVTGIQNFLSPWLHDDAADIDFGGRIHRSRILQFIEQQEYVDFVTHLRMDQQVAGTWYPDVEEALASHAGAVLASAPADEYAIGTAVASCEDEPKPRAAGPVRKAAAAAASRFLGNTDSRELHDLNNLTPMCQVDRIAVDRQRRFFSIAEARGTGYRLCPHCFGRGTARHPERERKRG